MDSSQRVEIESQLQKRAYDDNLKKPQIELLSSFVAASTAKLTAGLTTPPEHIREVTLMAAHQLETDPFTGMFNKAGFEIQLKAAMQVAKETGLTLTLLFIDGDNFGDINKDLGYDIGDRVITAIAEATGESARRLSDIKAHLTKNNREKREDGTDENNPITREARQGGDEFAVIILGDNLEGAKKVEDQVRRNIADEVNKYAPEYKNHYGKDLTVSIGNAQFDNASQDSEDKAYDKLVNEASLALQTEKMLKRFGNIPVPDLDNLPDLMIWINTFVKIPPPSEGNLTQFSDEERLEKDRQLLFGLAEIYGKTTPKNVLNILAKAATRETA